MDVLISGALFFHISPCSSTFDDPDGCKVRVLVSFLQLVTWWCRSISNHKPEHLQLYCVAIATTENSGEANEMFHKKLGDVLLRCTLARESARRLPPLAPKVFPSKSHCQERRLADQRCSSRQSWNTEVLHELRHARNPSDWTSTRCRMVVVEVEGPRPLRSERGACEFDFFNQEPMGSVDEPHGSSETINDVFHVMRDDVLTQRCSKERRRHTGLQRSTSIYSASDMLKSASDLRPFCACVKSQL